MHEELGRHDVESLAHVFADAHHRLAAAASGVLRFVVVLDATQVLGQRLTARLALVLRRRLVSLIAFVLQCLQLCIEIGFVFGQRRFEQLALLGAHRLGLRAELPTLQPGELEHDALDLGVLELDLAIPLRDVRVLGFERGLLGGQLRAIGGQLRQQRRRKLVHGTLAQTLEVLGRERVHIEHEPIVCSPSTAAIGASSNCPMRPPSQAAHRARRSQVRDDLHVLQALPRQAQHERFELRLRQRWERAGGAARPHEAALVQAPRGAPDAEAVVQDQLHARTPGIGEEVTVVGSRGAEHFDDAGDQAISPSTHVHRLRSQPHRVNADHRSSSRIQAAHSAAASAGQVMVIEVVPLRSSMRMSQAALVAGSCIGTNLGGAGLGEPVGTSASG